MVVHRYTWLYKVVKVCTRLYKVEQGWTRLYKVAKGWTRFTRLYIGCKRLLGFVQGPTMLYKVVQGCIRFYKVVQGRTRMCKAVQGWFWHNECPNDTSMKLGINFQISTFLESGPTPGFSRVSSKCHPWSLRGRWWFLLTESNPSPLCLHTVIKRSYKDVSEDVHNCLNDDFDFSPSGIV